MKIPVGIWSETLGRFFAKHGLIFISIIAILPFAVLSFYNNPSGTDDYLYAATARESGIFPGAGHEYERDGGRYISTPLVAAAHFSNYWMEGLRVLPLFILTLLWGTIHMFIKELFGKSIGLHSRFTFSLCFMFAYLRTMASPAQGFYWSPGAIEYQLGSVLLLIAGCSLLHIARESTPFRRTAFIATGCICAALIPGSNEFSLLKFLCIIILVSTVTLLKNRSVNGAFAGVLCISTIASLISLFAPGNFVRASQMPLPIHHGQHQFAISLLLSGKALYHMLQTFLTSTCFWVLALFYFSLAGRALRRFRQDGTTPGWLSVNPYVLVSATLVILFLCFFPTAWISHSEPPQRAMNNLYLFFLVAFLMTALSFLNRMEEKGIAFGPFSQRARILLGLVLVLDISTHNNIRTAYEDLFSGAARKYNQEMAQMLKAMRDCPLDTCVVDSLRTKPATLFHIGANPDAQYWANLEQARYFHKSAIKLR